MNKTFKLTVSLQTSLLSSQKESIELEGQEAFALYNALVRKMKYEATPTLEPTPSQGSVLEQLVENKKENDPKYVTFAKMNTTPEEPTISNHDKYESKVREMEQKSKKAIMSCGTDQTSMAQAFSKALDFKTKVPTDRDILVYKQCDCDSHIWLKCGDGAKLVCRSCNATHVVDIDKLKRVDYHCECNHRGVFYTEDNIDMTVCKGCGRPIDLHYFKKKDAYMCYNTLNKSVI